MNFITCSSIGVNQNLPVLKDVCAFGPCSLTRSSSSPKALNLNKLGTYCLLSTYCHSCCHFFTSLECSYSAAHREILAYTGISTNCSCLINMSSFHPLSIRSWMLLYYVKDESLFFPEDHLPGCQASPAGSRLPVNCTRALGTHTLVSISRAMVAAAVFIITALIVKVFTAATISAKEKNLKPSIWGNPDHSFFVLLFL